VVHDIMPREMLVTHQGLPSKRRVIAVPRLVRGCSGKKENQHGRLNVERVIAEFREAESSPAHHKGTFEINAPFEDALGKILEAQRT
jgi:hypothetical protein